MVKQAVLSMVNDLPENTTFDEVMYKLYILSNHERAMQDIKEGRTYSTEEVSARLQSRRSELRSPIIKTPAPAGHPLF